MKLDDYIRNLLKTEIGKKTFIYMDDIVIYLENSIVYKVAFRFNDNMMKGLKKLKIYSVWYFVENPPKERIDDDLIKNSNEERLTIDYNKLLRKHTVFKGEDIKMVI